MNTAVAAAPRWLGLFGRRRSVGFTPALETEAAKNDPALIREQAMSAKNLLTSYAGARADSAHLKNGNLVLTFTNALGYEGFNRTCESLRRLNSSEVPLELRKFRVRNGPVNASVGISVELPLSKARNLIPAIRKIETTGITYGRKTDFSNYSAGAIAPNEIVADSEATAAELALRLGGAGFSLERLPARPKTFLGKVKSLFFTPPLTRVQFLDPRPTHMPVVKSGEVEDFLGAMKELRKSKNVTTIPAAPQPMLVDRCVEAPVEVSVNPRGVKSSDGSSSYVVATISIEELERLKLVRDDKAFKANKSEISDAFDFITSFDFLSSQGILDKETEEHVSEFNNIFEDDPRLVYSPVQVIEMGLQPRRNTAGRRGEASVKTLTVSDIYRHQKELELERAA